MNEGQAEYSLNKPSGTKCYRHMYTGNSRGRKKQYR